MLIIGCSTNVSSSNLDNSKDSNNGIILEQVVAQSSGSSIPTEEASNKTAPSPRVNSALVYDSHHNIFVLFGGESDAHFYNDTWEYDGSQWVRLEIASPPPERSKHGMVFDGNRGVVVLFGGITVSGTYLDDLWELDNGNWVQKSITSDIPTARNSPAMTYASKWKGIFMFGGDTPGGEVADFWFYNGSNWMNQSHLTDAIIPSIKQPEIVYDPKREVLILTKTFNDNIYEFDGSQWTVKDNIIYDEQFISFISYDLAYDKNKGRVIIYNNSVPEEPCLWEYNGAELEKAVTSLCPPFRWGQAMAFNEKEGLIMVFGGVDNQKNALNDVWKHQNDSWTMDFNS